MCLKCRVSGDGERGVVWAGEGGEGGWEWSEGRGGEGVGQILLKFAFKLLRLGSAPRVRWAVAVAAAEHS